MAGVRLHRSQLHRPGAPLPVGVLQCGQLHRVAERCPGAMPLDQADVAGLHLRCRQCLLDQANLRRRTRHHDRHSLAVVVDTCCQHAPVDPVSESPRSGFAFDDDHTGPFTPQSSGGIGRIRPAVSVRCQPVVLGELVKRSRRTHHANAAGKRPITFVVADRSGSEVQCRQRRSTGGVHTDRWTDESEAV